MRPGHNPLRCPRHVIYILALFIGLSGNSFAANTFVGDFETGDLSQFAYLLNPDGIKLDENCAEGGDFGARFTLTGDDAYLWNGNPALERSEVNISLPKADTYEGRTTDFSFYFYLPKMLSEARHELGYWESKSSWQQMFRFSIRGTRLEFQETAQQKPFWSLPTGASPNRWHKVSMRILWSTDPAKGYVKVWVDRRFQGEYHFKTLPSHDAQMFTQLGMLRDQAALSESICIDTIKVKTR